MARVLVVANRLPVAASVGPDGLTVAPSPGGLASGLSKVLETNDGEWIGWPGVTSDQLDAKSAERLRADLAAARLVPVDLDKDEAARFYDGFSNSFIWPILHSLTGWAPLDTADWEVYRTINQRFADAVVERYRPGDLVWVHDFHLLLVPAMVRARLPDAAIGFFLHVPFPTADVFRTLPRRTELLEGLLGSSLIGFHTASYLRYFSTAVAELLGFPTEIDRIAVAGRAVKVGVFPIGVDASRFAAMAAEPGVEELIAEIRGADDTRIMVAVDRLDYTKGVPRRLLAFERLLEAYPDLRERVRLINLSVPTREAVPAYQDFRQEVERLVGRINGKFSTPRWTPIHYLFRTVDAASLVALYRAADVMLVTPIRDGMNLVSKEFVASRVDGDGVLLLSEFAGAAADLPEAVIVNPYEIDRLAEKMADALALPETERRRRMEALRNRVFAYDGDWWSRTFLDSLAAEQRREAEAPVRLRGGGLRLALRAFSVARRRYFLVDYDGTLVPLAAEPRLALPDADLLELLGRLAADRRNVVHLVSGRSAGFLDRWLGTLRIHLHAEHGAAHRPLDGREWIRRQVGLEWMERVRGVFEDFNRVTPGAFTETKEFGLCWHWRQADPTAAKTATELTLHLSQVLHRTGAEVLVGNRVVEVRAAGINKGLVTRQVVADAPPGSAFLAAGDDLTDEDLFRELPPGGISIRVGAGETAARFVLPDAESLRAVLREIVTTEPARK